MAKRQTPIFIPDDASPECCTLLRAMMDVTAAYGPNPVDLANAYFSGMCYALSRMQDINERDALLDSLAATAKEAVLANASIKKDVAQQRKKL